MAKQILVEVKSSEVASKSGTSARSGKPYHIREQSAYAVFPGKAYPVEIKFSLGDDQALRLAHPASSPSPPPSRSLRRSWTAMTASC